MDFRHYKRITRESYNRIAKRFYQETKSKQLINELEKFISFFSLRARNKIRILDLGCGPGRDSEYLSQRGFNVTGIDFSPQMIKFARRTVPKATFYMMDIEHLNFPTRSFNGIWATASLQRIPKKSMKKVLKDIYKILKPNGIFFCDLRKGKKEVIEIGSDYTKRFGPIQRFITYWSKREFIQLLHKVGFYVIDAYIVQEQQRPFRKIRFFTKK